PPRAPRPSQTAQRQPPVPPVPPGSVETKDWLHAARFAECTRSDRPARSSTSIRRSIRLVRDQAPATRKTKPGNPVCLGRISRAGRTNRSNAGAAANAGRSAKRPAVLRWRPTALHTHHTVEMALITETGFQRDVRQRQL